MTARETLLAEAAKRILITDGAFGTEIQNWKLSEADYAGTLGLAKDQKGNNDILALTKPEVPETITREYLDAGSDIVSTNTFSANAVSQGDYGLESLCFELNVEAARLADGSEFGHDDRLETARGRRPWSSTRLWSFYS